MATTGPVLVGVDAGATKSVAVAVDAAGAPLGRAQAGGANPKRQGLDAAADTIARLVAGAAGVRSVGLLLVAGAGIDRPEHARALEAALAALVASRRIVVVNDTLAALRLGTPDGVGLAVPVSTGGNVIGRGPDGRVTDRGHGLFGGGYVLGALAVRAARRGGVEATLARAIGGAGITWRGRRPGPEAAGVAVAVLDAAAGGDRYPARMVDRWCGRITDAVREEVERLGLGDAPAVVVYGGLLDASPWLAARVRSAVLAGAPGARLAQLAGEPVEGAVLLARDAWAGRPVRWAFEPRERPPRRS